MKDINTIEKALVKKADAELVDVVDGFIKSIKELDLRYGYKGSYFDLKNDYKESPEKITCITLEALRRILFNMLKEQFSQRMLNKKSKELLDKLEIL